MENRAIDKDHALVKTEAQEVTKPRGMTLDEISHQRALLAIKKEFCKEKLVRDLDKVKSKLPFSGSGDSHTTIRNVGGIASRLMSGLNYLDYALLGVSAFNVVKKISGLFRQRKK